MKVLRFYSLALLLAPLAAQTAAPAKTPAGTAEQRTARRFESIKGDPILLRQFLYKMPKGGDLHNHMSGAVYAESYIEWAAQDGWCVENETLNIVRPSGAAACDARTQRPATDALADPALYTAMIDAMSVRNWNPAQRSGQAQFFATFGRFDMGLAGSRFGSAFAELRRRNAAQNVHYLELIVQIDQARALIEAPKKLQWKETAGKPDFAAMHHQLAAGGLFQEKRSSMLDKAEAAMNAELGCGTATAAPRTGPWPEAACALPLRYQCQVLRAFPRESVFAQIAFCFELANSDPRVVTLNLVQPEDWHVPVRDFELHMRMIDYFHQQFPKMKITLHAGELTFGQVPPEVLGKHIPMSIDMGHAVRIGHGTDVMHYARPADLLQEMVAKKVAVEISPSSSKYILGLEGKRHPFRHYLKAGVPIAISTDDEGVARSDLTNEYQQAVEQHGLTYAEVKKIALDSLAYGFLPDAEKSAAMTKLRAAFVEFEKNHGP